jgi:hypothetical protein
LWRFIFSEFWKLTKAAGLKGSDSSAVEVGGEEEEVGRWDRREEDEAGRWERREEEEVGRWERREEGGKSGGPR